MGSFNWKRKFDAAFTYIDSSDGFDRYHIENETGDGTITACTFSPSLQAIEVDLRMRRCKNLLQPDKNVIEMNYCLDGRFEGRENNRYSYMIAARNFSVCYAGRKVIHGEFPDGRYHGISVFLDVKWFLQQHTDFIRDLSFRMERLQALAATVPRRFILHPTAEFEMIQTAIADGFRAKSVPRLRFKVMELLLFLSNMDDAAANDTPAYINKSLVVLIKSGHKLLTADLSRHLTIEDLAARLGMGTTALKRGFKSVYGIPIYQYLKNMRLQEAQRLLRVTTLPVFAIAAKVGYANPAKFSTAFRNRFGVSPKEYRRNTISDAMGFPVTMEP